METSIVRQNLMENKEYRPYCGNPTAFSKLGGCSNPRTYWDDKFEQFICPQCMWVSNFEPEFIAEYKKKHNL